MNQSDTNTYRIDPGQSYEIDLFRPDDAEGVVQLFLSVYGSGYPIKTFTDPEKLKEENKACRTISSVARTAKGDIVGHNALFHSAPWEGIFESGAGAVHIDYRGGKGIFTDMFRHGIEVAAVQFGISAIFGEPVCNHVFSQRLTHGGGFISHAVELDLMPAQAYQREKSAKGRVSSFLDFLTIRPRPHTVYLPPVYEDRLRFIYEALDDKRELMVTDEGAPAGDHTVINTQYFDFAQVARVAVPETGPEFNEAFGKEEHDILVRGGKVIQVWLNLARPETTRAVEALRRKGYILGGVLPRWFDDDGILMQKIIEPTHWEDIQIYTDRARELMAMVRQERESPGPE